MVKFLELRVLQGGIMSAQANKNMTNMAEGPILSTLLAFALPMMLGSLFTDLYNLADLSIAGYTIGDEALAAISATSGLMSFITATSRGFNIGNAIAVSNAFGEKDMEKTRKNLAGMMILCFGLSLVMTLIFALFVRPLMNLINTPAGLFDHAYSYIIVIILGLTATMSYDLFACAFRSLGNSRLPLYLLIICSVLNVFLDCLFMAVFSMGVFGAALATVLSQLTSALVSGFLFYRLFPELHFKKTDFQGLLPVLKEMCPLGVSGALTNSMFAIGWIILQSGINSLGQDTLVAYAAYKKISMFTILPSVSLANTLATFSAQNYGAGKLGRITNGIKTACGCSFLINIVSFAIIFFFGRSIITLITNTQNETVIEQAYNLLLVTTAFVWAQTVIMGFRMSIQGMRRKLIPFLGTFLELLIRSVFALVFIPLIGYIAIGWAESACWVIGGLMMMICYFIILRKEIFQNAVLDKTKA